MRTHVKNKQHQHQKKVIEAARDIARTEHNPATETDLAKPRRPGPKPGMTHWSEKDLLTIIDRICAGQTLTQILRDPETPDYATFFKLLYKNEALVSAYSAARKIQASALVERTLDEADQETDPQMAALLRVKSDSRRWAAARFAPDVFGETKRLEVSGEVRHAHVLDLAQEQRRRIAEEWLMSTSEAAPTRKPITIDAKAEPDNDANRPQPEAKPQKTQTTPET